jgi:hypothetical protein
MALLVRELVPLLEAYRRASTEDEPEVRLDLADAMLQGISADPELFVARLDLLGPSTTIEPLFVESDEEGAVRLTRMGVAQEEMLRRYRQLVGEIAGRLREDLESLDPSGRTYSPLGIAYGFCEDLLLNMALSTLQGPPPGGVSLEGLFVTSRDPECNLASARGWERLFVSGAGYAYFEHSAEWARLVFQRTIDALDLRAHSPQTNASRVKSARVFVVPRGQKVGSSACALPDGIVSAQEHCVTSDVNRAFSEGTTAFPRSQILSDRNEGRLLASAEVEGRWFGVSKTILTDLIGRGFDALIVDVPEGVIDVMRVTCPGLIVVVGES